MFSYVWPIALAVVSNIFYQICAKSTPEGMDPLASLTVTYTVGAAAAGALALPELGAARSWSFVPVGNLILGILLPGLLWGWGVSCGRDG